MNRWRSQQKTYLLETVGPVEFDCASQQMRRPWSDVTVREQYTSRSYGDESFDRYAPSRFKPVADTGFERPLLDWACHLDLPNERLVNVARTASNDLIQVDVASIKRSGATTSFWTRRDYPEIDVDPPYHAPYDSKRLHVQVNCSTEKYRVLFGYDFTPDEAVTDAMVENTSADEPLDAGDDYARAIKPIACGKPLNAETFSGIGGQTIRPKAPLNTAPVEAASAIPAEVLAEVKKLQAILPVADAARSAKLTVIGKDAKTSNTNPAVVHLIQPKKDGRTHIHSIYRQNVTMDHEMAGLVELSSKLTIGAPGATSTFVTTGLTLDAPAWRPNTEIVFSSESSGTGAPIKSKTTCTIGEPVAANTIHPALAGRAWALKCNHSSQGASEGYYVEELGYFLTMHTVPKELPATDYSIQSLSVER
ncbi:hypothetical protein LMG19083_03727 [Ralstonia psammae]|uniref:Surface-adhesin protein E-like domain-containing protein n=2 Tax=Ralstonia psammae TaxID=3058598 RepID=A0ABN9J6C7_9RALS|nr:hypothetical protein LMG19083_03727 [Ralstonia sp. LMG 19083]